MQLTSEEQVVLDGKFGSGRKFAMKILTNLGDLYGAAKFVDISAVQLTNPTNLMARRGWIELIKFYTAKRLKPIIPSFSEPVSKIKPGMFESDKKKITESKDKKIESIKSQKKQLDSLYKKLGVQQIGNYPSLQNKIQFEKGTHLAVSDRAEAVFFNSVYGIRTNIESSAAALASSFLGKTTFSGIHLIENRIPDIEVRINTELESGDLTYIGIFIGERFKNKIPYFRDMVNNKIYSERELYELGTALTNAGNVPMFHMEGVTPEQNLFRSTALITKLKIAEKELFRIKNKWQPSEFPDIIAVGAPYADLDELQYAAKMIKARGIKSNLSLWFFTSSGTYKNASHSGLIKKLESEGAFVFKDCIFKDLPLELMKSKTILTDSARALEFRKSARKNQSDVKLAPTKECIGIASRGRL